MLMLSLNAGFIKNQNTVECVLRWWVDEKIVAFDGVTTKNVVPHLGGWLRAAKIWIGSAQQSLWTKGGKQTMGVGGWGGDELWQGGGNWANRMHVIGQGLLSESTLT